MVAFAVCQPEQPLFQNGVASIPQGQGETQTLLVI